MSALVLEDSVLDRLAMNPMAIVDMPYLRQLAQALQANRQGNGCGRCGRRNVDISLTRNEVKAHMARLGTAASMSLKKFLGGDSFRFFYNEGAGVKEAVI